MMSNNKFNIKSLLRSIGYCNEQKYGSHLFFSHPRGRIMLDYLGVYEPLAYLKLKDTLIYVDKEASIEDIKSFFISEGVAKNEEDFKLMKTEGDKLKLEIYLTEIKDVINGFLSGEENLDGYIKLISDIPLPIRSLLVRKNISC